MNDQSLEAALAAARRETDKRITEARETLNLICLDSLEVPLDHLLAHRADDDGETSALFFRMSDLLDALAAVPAEEGAAGGDGPVSDQNPLSTIRAGLRTGERTLNTGDAWTPVLDSDLDVLCDIAEAAEELSARTGDATGNPDSALARLRAALSRLGSPEGDSE